MNGCCLGGGRTFGMRAELKLRRHRPRKTTASAPIRKQEHKPWRSTVSDTGLDKTTSPSTVQPTTNKTLAAMLACIIRLDMTWAFGSLHSTQSVSASTRNWQRAWQTSCCRGISWMNFYRCCGGGKLMKALNLHIFRPTLAGLRHFGLAIPRAVNRCYLVLDAWTGICSLLALVILFRYSNTRAPSSRPWEEPAPAPALIWQNSCRHLEHAFLSLLWMPHRTSVLGCWGLKCWYVAFAWALTGASEMGFLLALLAQDTHGTPYWLQEPKGAASLALE
jgi:hypothetical protein